MSEKIAAWFLVKPHIQVLLLHKLYPSEKDIHTKNGSCDEGITIDYFEKTIEWFKKRGYEFITPTNILNKECNSNRRYIMLTFDDGYFNNYLALPILEKWNVKATFYISTQHIIEGKSFWWDAVYREKSKMGVSNDMITQEVVEMIKWPWNQAEKLVLDTYGPDALIPKNDLDRPMTLEELREFSKHPLVEIGNHTSNHLNLPNYDSNEIRESILQAEKDLLEWTGEKTLSISYPYGFYDSRVVQLSEDLGYRFAVTVDEGKTTLGEISANNNALKVKRSHFVGWIPLEDQCYNIFSGFSLISYLKGN